MIVVTKCPEGLTATEKKLIENKLELLPKQSIFFSSIVYSERIINTNSELPLSELSNRKITLVTGIANPKPIVEYLQSMSMTFDHLEYKDHHQFSKLEIETLQKKEVILTTEKDYVRLKDEFEFK